MYIQKYQKCYYNFNEHVNSVSKNDGILVLGLLKWKLINSEILKVTFIVMWATSFYHSVLVQCQYHWFHFHMKIWMHCKIVKTYKIDELREIMLLSYSYCVLFIVWCIRSWKICNSCVSRICVLTWILNLYIYKNKFHKDGQKWSMIFSLNCNLLLCLENFIGRK